MWSRNKKYVQAEWLVSRERAGHCSDWPSMTPQQSAPVTSRPLWNADALGPFVIAAEADRGCLC